MNAEFILALNQIEKEKGISKDILIEAIENSLITACKNNYGTSQNIKVNIDREKGDVVVYAEKEVVETVEDPHLTISLEKAKEIDKAYEIGDIVNIEVTPKNFGRIAAGKAKQVVVQKIREAERDVLFNQYITKEKEIVTGIIQREVKGSVVVNLGKIDAMLVDKEQVPGEVYPPNERLKVYVIEVKESTKGPKIYVSRTHPELIKRLFEQEVPEVHDGVVEIKSISREAGSRTKIAVHSNNSNVDPVGSCVGHNGARVGIIVHELKGEKIDIVPWSEDPAKFISAALSPSKVVKVAVDIKVKSAKVVVPDYQLSLAIGKEGQNARLAAKLTGYKIDIKSETQAKETNFILESDEVIIPIEDKFAQAHTIEEDMDIFAKKPKASKAKKDLFEE
ncbi:MAG: transcription termination/antitermination protein NusA [Firmicutes bacterium HGW-Firmicutes-1]|jgi:N utilization substance protein A|nr:MAG: transcription termination/antitermination protein NusA [Firmicutes bacterium HGW-Firmicutes-1]